VALENDGPVTLILDSRGRKAVKKVKDALSRTDTVIQPQRPEKGELWKEREEHDDANP